MVNVFGARLWLMYLEAEHYTRLGIDQFTLAEHYTRLGIDQFTLVEQSTTQG